MPRDRPDPHSRAAHSNPEAAFWHRAPLVSRDLDTDTRERAAAGERHHAAGFGHRGRVGGDRLNHYTLDIDQASCQYITTRARDSVSLLAPPPDDVEVGCYGLSYFSHFPPRY